MSLIGIGTGDRYNHADASLLQAVGMYGDIHSGELHASPNETVSLSVFWRDDFTGPFLQMSAARGGGGFSFWATGQVDSWMLTATGQGKGRETRISYHDQFLPVWDSVIDDKLNPEVLFLGTKIHVTKGRRNGEPVLSWAMFPNEQYLNAGLTYLKVHQDVIVYTPWPYADYRTSLDYWIFLFVDKGDLHADVVKYAWWVEGGIITGKVADDWGPAVKEAAGTLRDTLNDKLKLARVLANGAINDVFYLPGRQGSAPSGDVHGSTDDDVTIVVVT